MPVLTSSIRPGRLLALLGAIIAVTCVLPALAGAQESGDGPPFSFPGCTEQTDGTVDCGYSGSEDDVPPNCSRPDEGGQLTEGSMPTAPTLSCPLQVGISRRHAQASATTTGSTGSRAGSVGASGGARSQCSLSGRRPPQAWRARVGPAWGRLACVAVRLLPSLNLIASTPGLVTTRASRPGKSVHLVKRTRMESVLTLLSRRPRPRIRRARVWLTARATTRGAVTTAARGTARG